MAKGLTKVAIDGFFSNMLAIFQRRGVHQFTLKEGGNITPQMVMQILRRERIYFKRTGNSFVLAKVHNNPETANV